VNTEAGGRGQNLSVKKSKVMHAQKTGRLQVSLLLPVNTEAGGGAQNLSVQWSKVGGGSKFECAKIESRWGGSEF